MSAFLGCRLRKGNIPKVANQLQKSANGSGTREHKELLKHHASEIPPQVSHRAESSQTTQHVTPKSNKKAKYSYQKNAQPPNATAVLMQYIIKKQRDTVKSFSKINQYKAKTKVFEINSSIEEEEILSISETGNGALTQSRARNISVDNVMENPAFLTHQIQQSNQSLRHRQSEVTTHNLHFQNSTQKTYTDLSGPNYQSQHGKFQENTFSCAAGFYEQALQQIRMNDEDDEM
ncbi:uncharacterized protein LOC130898105 [Diorhabda carinulata]|uniref:uncharacterized protein LOC130898105 n=1 Tax=Diorhabda carinulata TaxID=1163345 RepID=UPI0025A12D2F|nr:uncharacterized protein LOC130898105 [Diorhabda carinulata]